MKLANKFLKTLITLKKQAITFLKMAITTKKQEYKKGSKPHEGIMECSYIHFKRDNYAKISIFKHTNFCTSGIFMPSARIPEK